MSYKLGSLFDGSGGFPLAGALCGIEPVWASEVEPYPIAVTKSRFPNMKHLGDISKINGAEIEPVDIITFGSPCQDLSVAGKRAGLKHEANGDEETTRSGLFIEAVRIIKEMRKATNGEYPRYAIWENVPGAFSSNKGEDFRVVLEELIKVVEPTAVMPEVPQKGWNYADCYTGDGWSLAYRVLDAQYWGVPQRRRRIYLVTDFRGECAKEILFERKGLRGYFTQGRTPWQNTSSRAEGSPRADDREGVIAIDKESYSSGSGFDRAPGITVGGPCATLQAQGVPHAVCYPEPKLFENHSQDTRYTGPLERAQTVSATYGMGGNNQPFVVEPVPFCKSRRAKSPDDYTTWKDGKVANTLNTFDQGEVRANELVVEPMLFENHGQEVRFKGPLDVAPTAQAGYGEGGSTKPLVIETHPVICLQGNGIDRADTAGCNGKGWREDKSYTLNTIDRPAVCVADHPTPKIDEKGTAFTLSARDYKNPQALAYNDNGRPHYIVRRLTPTECARLQGFADRWGDIDKKADLTDEEYKFWLEVRKTHDAINGRPNKDYTVKQMLTWYNKLQTDSSEYKMWGNGIALPTALYVMQGVAEALSWAEFM